MERTLLLEWNSPNVLETEIFKTNVKNTIDRGRLSKFEQKVQVASAYFQMYPQTS